MRKFQRIIVVIITLILLSVSGYVSENYLYDFSFSQGSFLISRLDFLHNKAAKFSIINDPRFYTLFISIVIDLLITCTGVWYFFHNKKFLFYTFVIFSVASFCMVLPYLFFIFSKSVLASQFFQSLKQWVLSPFLFLMLIPVFSFIRINPDNN